ncbi:MAG: sucrase ferredoxin [Polyangiales bacterium]
MTAEYCADASVAVGEPLAGTAIAGVDRYLVLEHAIPWGPKGLEDSDVPVPIVERLRALSARHPRLRVQLVRKMGGAPAQVRQLYLASSGEGEGEIRSLAIGDEALLTLDLEPWLAGTGPAPGALEREPLVLVCVHGRRDRCCARLGMPVYRALAAIAEPRVWQTTHLGGHRFAATLLVLPQGVCYGRVAPGEAAALLTATKAGALHALDRIRGRTAYPPEAQAAEVMLRERLHVLRDDAFLLRAVEPLGTGTRVRFFEHASQREHEVDVAREALPPAPASCGAAPKSGARLVPLASLRSSASS